MKAWLVPAASLLGAGWFFATAIIAGVVVGRWVDGETGFEPTFTLVGVVIGLAVALLGGYRLVQPLISRLDDEPSE